MDRRSFHRQLAGAAFTGLASMVGGSAFARDAGTSQSTEQRPEQRTGAMRLPGPLQADPAGLLDLPQGWSYRVISRMGDRMDDGHVVADKADGMGCIALGGGKVALIRNHELSARDAARGAFGTRAVARAFDRWKGDTALPGGTSTMIYDLYARKIEAQFASLAGTIRNCAGGTTPWGSWLSCEEDVSLAGESLAQDHGWVFEVPASARGLVDPVPLKGLGRFNHEAATVDPATGIIYLTEDRDNGLFYRFLPDSPGRLAAGGRLQALALQASGVNDTRNWNAAAFPPRTRLQANWIDLNGTDSRVDDLRKRGHASGGAIFARGEGIHFGNGELFFTCTSGGAAKLGQVFRYIPAPNEGHERTGEGSGWLENFFESTDPMAFNFGDNLTIAPNGHLIVCEDQYTDIVDNHLRGITPTGEAYAFARCRLQTEMAGACFAPDGTLFVNLYSPGMTLAITGPGWD